MISVGLTGGIAAGKSEVGSMFASLGAAVFDSDAHVHRLYREDAAVKQSIARRFGEQVITSHGDGTQVDRTALIRTLGDEHDWRALGAIIHPAVREGARQFLASARAKGVAVGILDVPLLFESGGWEWLDLSAAVVAPPEARRARAMARHAMTEQKFRAIISRQCDDAQRCARADYVITSIDPASARAQVSALYARLLARERGA